MDDVLRLGFVGVGMAVTRIFSEKPGITKLPYVKITGAADKYLVDGLVNAIANFVVRLMSPIVRVPRIAGRPIHNTGTPLVLSAAIISSMRLP